MPRSWFSVQALAPGSAEINIRGIIGDWGLTDRDLIAEVECLGEVAEITLRINSRGGDVDQALSMFNYLRSHPARVTARVEGVAMSAATIVLMAADHIVMPSNTLLMIHNPYFPDEQDARLTDAARESLTLWREALVETYTARARVSREELGTLLDEQTFMAPERAMELGFCDEIEQVGAAGAPQALAVLACAAGIPDDMASRLLADAGQGEANPEHSGEGAVAAVPPELSAPHATLASQIVAAAAELDLPDFAPVIVVASDVTTVESARALLVQACEVRDLCRAAGFPDAAQALIRERVPLAQARERLASRLAAQSDALDVTNHQAAGQPANDRRAGVTTAAIWAARRKTTL